MLQEAADELFGFNCWCMPVAFVVLPAEGNLTLFEADDALVGDGDAEDVWRQVLQGTFAFADRLDVDDLTPRLRSGQAF
jgi:hypothetical protein